MNKLKYSTSLILKYFGFFYLLKDFVAIFAILYECWLGRGLYKPFWGLFNAINSNTVNLYYGLTLIALSKIIDILLKIELSQKIKEDN